MRAEWLVRGRRYATLLGMRYVERRVSRLAVLCGIAAAWFSAACGNTSRIPASTSAAPAITALYPPQARAGQKFQVQPDGQAAIAIGGKNFQKGAKILFNSRPLDTAFGNEGAVTATVPDDLIAQPGTIQVRVENPDGKASAPVNFIVLSQ
jgi:hypothetical protein